MQRREFTSAGMAALAAMLVTRGKGLRGASSPWLPREMLLAEIPTLMELATVPGLAFAVVDGTRVSTYVFGQVQIPGAEFGAFHRDLFERYFVLATALLKAGLIWPALEHTLKCSHLFNILDSSNSIGVTERTAFILRIRQLAIGVAKTYVEGSAASAGAAGAGHAEASASGREA